MSSSASTRGPATPLVLAVQVVLVVALVLGAGAVAGLVWAGLWDPPTGVVQSGRWFTDETGLRAEFAGVGLYVVTALVAGGLCGLISGLLLARWELLTLVVLTLAAVGAALLMRHVGLAQSPPDPDRLAAGAADGTRLPGDLRLAGRAPLVALPLGALVGYAVLLIALPGRGPGRSRAAADDPAESGLTDRTAG